MGAAADWLAAAVPLLTGSPAAQDRLVHELRTATKRARALVRLFGALLGGPDGRAAAARLHAAARALSGAREIAVARGLLRKLRRKHGGRDGAAIDVALRRLSPLSAPASGALAKRVTLRLATDALRGTVRRLRRVSVSEADACTIIEAGLRATHRRCRKQLRRVRATGNAAEFHTLRKLVKRLFYQLQSPALAASQPLRRLLCKLDELQEQLGDAHDAHVLATLLRTKLAGSAGEASTARLLRLLARRERKLHVRSLRLGKKLLAEKDAAFHGAVRSGVRPARPRRSAFV